MKKILPHEKNNAWQKTIGGGEKYLPKMNTESKLLLKEKNDGCFFKSVV